MIFADANVFLRYLSEPKTDAEAGFAVLASEMFARAHLEERVFTTTDAVIAEVVFVLSSKRHLDLTRAEVYKRLISVLRLPGCAAPDRLTLIDALMLWLAHSQISFVDSICLAASRRSGDELMTFDFALRRIERRERGAAS